MSSRSARIEVHRRRRQPRDRRDLRRTSPAAVLYLPFVQLLAYYRALAIGLDPDKPRNLSQVVVLDAR